MLGQAPRGKGPESAEVEFRDAIRRWSEGQTPGATQPADDRATRFAVGHEEVAIPVLVDAVKARLGTKEIVNVKQAEFFVMAAVDLITYNATQRAIDAVQELCRVDAGRCPSFIGQLLGHATSQLHPFRTAYGIVECYPQLREHVTSWVEEQTTKFPSTVTALAQELLKREKEGHLLNDNDSILSGLRPATRHSIDLAVVTERLEQSRNRKE
jgi:hypothetical protein